MNVVSGQTDSGKKAWGERNWSGSYHLYEFYNERPVYKVSFILSTNSCKCEIVTFYFSAG